MQNDQLPEYEVFAIKYAQMPRMRKDNFLGGDPHDQDMPMDFFVWLIRSPSHNILVDMGFNALTAEIRQRELLQCPMGALRIFGLTAEDISDVIVTHLHYDHAGNIDLLPSSTFHIQDAEMEYATGRCMCFSSLRHAYAVEDIISLVRKVYSNKVCFHKGNSVLFPGIELIKIGGHTKGLQAVRIHTARGWVVLASDASHFYENMLTERPFPIVFNTQEMLEGYAQLREAASSEEHIVPGHDPLVLEHYPAYNQSPLIACLHLSPVGRK